ILEHRYSWLPIGFARRRGRRPSGEREPVNLRIMADVHGKLPMEKEFPDPRRMRKTKSDFAQLLCQFSFVGDGVFGLHHQRRLLLPAQSQADLRAARDFRMIAKDLFARFSINGSRHRFNSLRNPPAKPESSLSIDAPRITHPMPNRSPPIVFDGGNL